MVSIVHSERLVTNDGISRLRNGNQRRANGDWYTTFQKGFPLAILYPCLIKLCEFVKADDLLYSLLCVDNLKSVPSLIELMSSYVPKIE